jgi:hypothetical protein
MDFSVERDAYGAPHIVTTAAAEIVLGRHLVESIKISLSHSASSATAVALKVPRVIATTGAGRFIFRWLPYRRNVILDNLRRVYGGNVPEEQMVSSSPSGFCLNSANAPWFVLRACRS